MNDAQRPEDTQGTQDRRRVLIVEDEYFIADDLAKGFAKSGIEIVGPVPSNARAMQAIDAQRIDGAVLDINLDGEPVYAVADALVARGVPIVFVTGYDQSVVPARFAQIAFCQKPVEVDKVVAALERAAS